MLVGDNSARSCHCNIFPVNDMKSGEVKEKKFFLLLCCLPANLVFPNLILPKVFGFNYLIRRLRCYRSTEKDVLFELLPLFLKSLFVL